MCIVLMALAVNANVQLGPSCYVHTSTAACSSPEATMTAFRKCLSSALRLSVSNLSSVAHVSVVQHLYVFPLLFHLGALHSS